MSDTTKTTESVIPRRRGDDWKKPLSVPYQDVFNVREGDAVAVLDDRAFARVGAALSGARAITAVLMQNSLDRYNDGGGEVNLRLGEVSEHGLFEALASCLELADMYATGGKPHGTTTAQAGDPEAQAMKQAAFNASVSMDNRSARARVEQLDKQPARAAGWGAA